MSKIKLASDRFQPRVSIIIPVYNGSNYIEEAINSALAQTYSNLEIIVVDDGSTDNTEQIAKSFGEKILYFRKKNGGTATALNYGIRKMTGKYFSWLSHDDTYYPNKIERQVEELHKLENKNTIIMSDLDGIDDKYEKIYQTNYIDHIKKYPPREKSFIHPVIYNQTHGCTLLIPTICFKEVGLFDEKELVAQDFEFFYRAFSKYPHKLVSEVLVTARDSAHRQGRRSHKKGDIEYSRLFIKIIENLTDDEIKLLAPNKLSFYNDMQDFFWSADYKIALEFIENKLNKNIQISSYDLVGNKFNGFDLHLYLRERAIDSKFIVLNKESTDDSTFIFNFELKDATKVLLRQKYFYDAELVHLHLIHNILDIAYLPVITKLKPTVISLHDPYFLAGHCVHHFDCMKWQQHCQDCPYLNDPFAISQDYSALNFEILKYAIQSSQITAIVASKWLAEQVARSPIWKGKKVYYLPFGINQEIFKPQNNDSIRKELNIPTANKVLMFRADSGPYKGLSIIKESLKQIKDPAQFTLISVGEKGHLKDINKSFQLLEYDWIKDDHQLSKFYNACDLFLMPSKQETFGMMAVEAMSCGKPVIVLEGPGTALPEVINSPECGLAVKEEDFINSMIHLIGNRKELIERGMKCLSYAKDKYSKEKYIEGIIRIYSEVKSHHEIDKGAVLTISQLKKHMLNDDYAYYQKDVSPVSKSIIRSIYSRIPLRIRKLNKKVLRILAPFFGRVIPETQKIRLQKIIKQ